MCYINMTNNAQDAGDIVNREKKLCYSQFLCTTDKFMTDIIGPALSASKVSHYVNVYVLTKDQSFYLNYHKFSLKSYVLDVY